MSDVEHLRKFQVLDNRYGAAATVVIDSPRMDDLSADERKAMKTATLYTNNKDYSGKF